MFLVLECHGGPQYAAIVTDIDGLNKVFDSYQEAEEECLDCQDGTIVEIN